MLAAHLTTSLETVSALDSSRFIKLLLAVAVVILCLPT